MLMVVFENDNERASCCADYGHDFANQPKLFGCEEEKFLRTCKDLFHASLSFGRRSDVAKLERKLYGIAKAHGLRVTWYGRGGCVCEPDRYLISGRGEKYLAFVQC